MVSKTRIEFGDWQTPDDLARDVVAHIVPHLHSTPRTILEPTCGNGAFLVAAAHFFPDALLVGRDINPDYTRTASLRLEKHSHDIRAADFFTVNWEEEIANLPEPILILGNPPWVTNAGLGAMGSANLPPKKNTKKLSGIDARTGKSNFDVSEWMISRLLRALAHRSATIAMLCKSNVARHIVELDDTIRPGGVWRINASKHFHAEVDAVLFVGHSSAEPCDRTTQWPVYASFSSTVPKTSFGLVDGALVADVHAYAQSRAIAGASQPEWRSGVKHDCARIMELHDDNGRWLNGLGENVDIEEAFRFPFLKSSDLANGRIDNRRALIVPQRFLGDDTRSLQESAPKLWAYLNHHAQHLSSRKSSIYQGAPPFAIFGVGNYSFAPWKVAISGLYKRLRFCVVGPRNDQPVLFDDTCYFLPFADESMARNAAKALESDVARDYFRGRIFWDAKRPISKAILQNLALQRLLGE